MTTTFEVTNGTGLHLRHYAHRRTSLIVSKRQHDTPGWKPRGLWVSVEGNDDGWREWCEREGFRTGWTHVYDVRLSDRARVLWLRNSLDLLDFDQLYGVESRFDRRIDWTRVAREFDGIIISPYQWSQRQNLFWYYGWDCASGCIWDADAIAGLERVEVA